MTLRKFDEVHIEEDCSNITGHKENCLFFGCTFDKLAGLTLKGCDLNKSIFNTSRIRDAMGLTISLDCFSFKSVSYSPLLMDLMLFLLTTTSGNDDRREQIASILGEEKMKTLTRVLRSIE